MLTKMETLWSSFDVTMHHRLGRIPLLLALIASIIQSGTSNFIITCFNDKKIYYKTKLLSLPFLVFTDLLSFLLLHTHVIRFIWHHNLFKLCIYDIKHTRLQLISNIYTLNMSRSKFLQILTNSIKVKKKKANTCIIIL